jgi:hypothetical protein
MKIVAHREETRMLPPSPSFVRVPRERTANAAKNDFSLTYPRRSADQSKAPHVKHTYDHRTVPQHFGLHIERRHSLAACNAVPASASTNSPHRERSVFRRSSPRTPTVRVFPATQRRARQIPRQTMAHTYTNRSRRTSRTLNDFDNFGSTGRRRLPRFYDILSPYGRAASIRSTTVSPPGRTERIARTICIPEGRVSVAYQSTDY